MISVQLAVLAVRYLRAYRKPLKITLYLTVIVWLVLIVAVVRGDEVKVRSEAITFTVTDLLACELNVVLVLPLPTAKVMLRCPLVANEVVNESILLPTEVPDRTVQLPVPTLQANLL